MKSLYLRIYLTVIAALVLFALGSAWLYQSHVQMERGRMEGQVSERVEAWADLLQRSLPPVDAPNEEQAAALLDWSQRLRLPMALDDVQGRRIAASEAYLRRATEAPGPAGAPRGLPVRLDDGRTLWVMRGGGSMQGFRADGGPRRGEAMDRAPQSMRVPMAPPWLRGTGLVALLVLLFLAVALGAWPVVRRLTRRLEALKQGVERFGAGALGQRVDASGRDEVAAVAASFNQAAGRIEALVRSHQSLLANASHELRSPLARMKMAVSMLDETTDVAARERLKAEIRTNIGELDALVEEVLLASRLDAQAGPPTLAPIELIAIAAEEAARFGAELQTTLATLAVPGDERLLRRALRNLLENARRYGAGADGVDISVSAGRTTVAPWRAELRVSDRGAGVPDTLRERIFEPFFRLPGHAEREGGVGLGLALVKQIAERHRGSVRCEPREGGGSCFVLSLPAA